MLFINTVDCRDWRLLLHSGQPRKEIKIAAKKLFIEVDQSNWIEESASDCMCSRRSSWTSC